MIQLLQKIKKNSYKSTGFNTERHNSFKNPIFIIIASAVVITIIFAYSNHFSNAFNFDDQTSIVNNYAIREINLIKFFSDGTTVSSLPTNQPYRPYLTTLYAIDYKLAGGLSPEIYHIHILISFLIVCFLLCVFVKKILDKIEFSNHNQFWGLLVAAIFGLLCANAETVNYVTQRAEITAGLYILAGFVAYLQGGFWRSKYVYLLFPFIGFFVKENAVVFAPLLFLYILIFEKNTDLLHFYKKEEFKKCYQAFLNVLPAFILTVLFYIFYKIMVPKSFLLGGGASKFQYIITQPLVLCHYFVTFFVPYNLSADSDWKVFTSIFNYKVIIGILLILGLIFLALKASKNKDTRLFSFGILWFFIAHLPTSSFISFTEILNDHRSFIPYLGLTIAFVFGSVFILERYFTIAIKQTHTQIMIGILLVIYLTANAYGVRERNKVWKNNLSLWSDVVKKSPKNGRGLMNYGIALMANTDYVNAEINFLKALQFSPYYSNLYINLGILKNATGDKVAAEDYFLKAISCPIFKHLSWYFYGQFLSEQGRYLEAIQSLKNSLELLPDYREPQYLLMQIHHTANDWKNLKMTAYTVLTNSPNDSTANKYLDYAINKKSIVKVLEEDITKAPTTYKYLSLSLKYFQMNEFEKCIAAANEALKLDSNYIQAYNNIGIANVNLKAYDKAITAYKKALSINPDYTLVKNNLAQAESLKSGKSTLTINIAKTSDDYITLSLQYYYEGKYNKCIEAAEKSNAIKPNAIAYNNICTAYNQLKQYDKAIRACHEALKLEPTHRLAKGNLDYAEKNK